MVPWGWVGIRHSHPALSRKSVRNTQGLGEQKALGRVPTETSAVGLSVNSRDHHVNWAQKDRGALNNSPWERLKSARVGEGRGLADLVLPPQGRQ